MLKPICLNYRHQIMIDNYLTMIKTYIEDITQDKDKFQDFIDVANIIIEHHNNYKSDALGSANYSDFMSIIPTHFTCMINGYLTGLENVNNRYSVRLYKHILSEHSYNLIEKLSSLEETNE